MKVFFGLQYYIKDTVVNFKPSDILTLLFITVSSHYTFSYSHTVQDGNINYKILGNMLSATILGEVRYRMISSKQLSLLVLVIICNLIVERELICFS